VFGGCPSQGAVPMEGLYYVTELMDTVGVFARDPKIFRDVSTVLLSTSSPLPRAIGDRKIKPLYPVRRPHPTVSDTYRWFLSTAEPGGAVAAEA
jgi:Asp-tRNA(Asn)/Glu-tRNA(Gln) amidotransferase A subunit family amidase